MQFLFNGSADEFYGLVKQVMAEIKTITTEKVYKKISSDCQLILVELLTNAIKHSGGSISVIQVVAGQASLTISRKDSGARFALQLPERGEVSIWEFFGEEKRMVIYSDDLSTLYGELSGEQEVTFKVEDRPAEGAIKTEGLIEHYGLIIITKASDAFTYTFDSKTGINRYTATMRFS